MNKDNGYDYSSKTLDMKINLRVWYGGSQEVRTLK